MTFYSLENYACSAMECPNYEGNAPVTVLIFLIFLRNFKFKKSRGIWGVFTRVFPPAARSRLTLSLRTREGYGVTDAPIYAFFPLSLCVKTKGGRVRIRRIS